MNKLMDGHQLNSRDPQTREILDSLGMSQSRISSPQFLGDVRVLDRKPFHVRFINYRLMRRCSRMSIIAPVKIGIDHHRFWHKGALFMSLGGPLGLLNRWANTASFHCT